MNMWRRLKRAAVRRCMTELTDSWYAFYSKKAYNMGPTYTIQHDGSLRLSTRACVYRTKDGREVVITAVYRSWWEALRNYKWKDKQLVGVVTEFVRPIYHDWDYRNDYFKKSIDIPFKIAYY